MKKKIYHEVKSPAKLDTLCDSQGHDFNVTIKRMKDMRTSLMHGMTVLVA